MAMIEFFSKKRSFFLKSIVGIIVVSAVGSSVIFYNLYRKSQIKNASAAYDIETTSAKVSKLIEFPNENPTLATVSDVSKLKDQEFFRNAQNGDKVLIFKNAGKAILYRPNTNKIIEVGPIKVEQPKSEVKPSPTVIPTTVVAVSPSVIPSIGNVTVSIYNGTQIAGLSTKISQQLSTNFPNIRINTMSYAAGKYPKTLVIDLKGTHQESAQSIASLLNAVVESTMPVGESNPGSDILVILGSQ